MTKKTYPVKINKKGEVTVSLKDTGENYPKSDVYFDRHMNLHAPKRPKA